MGRGKEGGGKKRESEIKEGEERQRERSDDGKHQNLGSIKTVRATKPQGNSVCGDEELEAKSRGAGLSLSHIPHWLSYYLVTLYCC